MPELYEVTRTRHERAVGWTRGDRDAATAPEVEQPLVAKGSEGAQDRIPVHAQLSGQISRWGEALAGRSLSVGDRAPDLRRDLLVQVGRGSVALKLDSMHGASDTSFIMSVRAKNRNEPQTAIDDAARALFEEARERARRRRRRKALVFTLVVAALVGAALVTLAGRDSTKAPPADERTTAAIPPPRTPVFVQLLNSTEPIAVVDPVSGTFRVLKLPTAGGDWLDRLDRTGGRLVWQGPRGTYAIDTDLQGGVQKLSREAFLPSSTEGRVWFAPGAHTRRGRRAPPPTAVEMTVRGRVTQRVTLGPCRYPIAALTGAFVCQERRRLLAFDPATRSVRRVRGLYPFATHGTTVAACEERCDAVRLTDVRTGRHWSVEPPSPYRPVAGYDGAFSPDGTLVAVPVAARDRGDDRRRAPLGVALLDVRRRSARIVPGARLAAAYRKFAWSSSGELFFAAGSGTIMAYRPGAPRAHLLPVGLGAPILDLAAG
jgi:hypothetical protein